MILQSILPSMVLLVYSRFPSLSLKNSLFSASLVLALMKVYMSSISASMTDMAIILS